MHSCCAMPLLSFWQVGITTNPPHTRRSRFTEILFYLRLFYMCTIFNFFEKVDLNFFRTFCKKCFKSFSNFVRKRFSQMCSNFVKNVLSKTFFTNVFKLCQKRVVKNVCEQECCKNVFKKVVQETWSQHIVRKTFVKRCCA